MRLAGRSAIITGGSLGLGRAIAERFVREGASVLLVARDPDRLEVTRQELLPLALSGQSIHVMAEDVAQPQGCDAIVVRARQTMENLAVLVNNAGVYGPLGSLEEVSWSEWESAIRINLFGTALMCRAIIPSFRERGSGKIINLSGGGATQPLPRISAYAASKAAVVRLTETLAHELRDAHIDVNAMAPGALNTRLLDEILAAGPNKVGRDFYERSVQQREKGGTPLDLGASLAAFLASGESDGITGRLLSAVWDDWQALPGWRAKLAQTDVYTLRRIVPADRGLDN